MYWTAQLLGWGIFFLMGYLGSRTEGELEIMRLVVFFLFTILLTHAYRFLIIKSGILGVSNVKKIVFVSLSSLIMSGIFVLFSWESTEYVMELQCKNGVKESCERLMRISKEDFSFGDYLINIMIFSNVFLAWSLMYYVFHLVQTTREREIKDLQWEASQNESELNNLKAQLNPHFMFNSMNSIRALIDEDPQKAKTAVTQLSTILRNTLLMGKRKVVSIGEELSIVEDYLSLEAIRYEERLQVSIDIPEGIKSYTIPPLTLQTLVENSIKHGIANYAKGGKLIINTSESSSEICIHMENPGKLKGVQDGTGTGLKNARQRLKLLFGEDADIILNENLEKVTTLVKIPKKPLNESSSNR